ncbi:hypothetical protein ACYA97_05590 [Klebsiella pneumoniae]
MTTDITELTQSKSLRKKLNRRLNDAYGFQRTSGGKHTTISLSIDECKSIIAAMDERLALVEALEKAQETIAFQQGEIKALLSSLESRTVTVKLPDYRNTYKSPFADEVEHQVRLALELFSSAAGIKVEAE